MAEDHWPAWHCPAHSERLIDEESQLACPAGHVFPRQNDIPRFVAAGGYAEGFGAQWNRYRLTQLDSYSGVPITATRAKRCVGDDLWENLAGKNVLECGCGAGRFTEVLLGQGARVTSVDLSDAVEANRENFPPSDHHRIAMANILELPFAPRQYDLVFSLGVIQHTPNPEVTIARLYDQVKPGGFLVFDHYTYTLSWFTKTAPLIRRHLRRLPPERGVRATEALVKALVPLHEKAQRHAVARVVVSRLSPVLHYGNAFPELDKDLLREWALLDTHDSLTDWYKHFRTRRRLVAVLNDLGVSDICCEYDGIGVEARGRRPPVAA